MTFVGRVATDALVVRGKDRVDLLHRLSTNDLLPLTEPGRAVHTLFTNEKGRVVDWVLALSQPDALVLRASPGRAATLAAWLDRYTIMEDVRCEEAAYELVVAHGAEASTLLGAVEEGRFKALHGGFLARGVAAYGERVELLVPGGGAEAVVAAAQTKGAKPLTPAVFEELRLAAGVPSPEHEFKEEVNPLELRLGGLAVSFTKGCYIGQEVIARLDAYDKLARVLMGFDGIDVPLGGDGKIERDGKPLGRVTSVARRDGGGSLGLAVVKREAAVPGPAELVTESGRFPVTLADRPFWA